jgi:hypothetical protein
VLSNCRNEYKLKSIDPELAYTLYNSINPSAKLEQNTFTSMKNWMRLKLHPFEMIFSEPTICPKRIYSKLHHRHCNNKKKMNRPQSI